MLVYLQKNNSNSTNMSTPTLKEKTARGLLWGGLSNGVQQVLNLLFGIFLARELTPADYGMVGMLAVFLVIATTLQESGFTAALVNKKMFRHEDYNAVFWFSILMSLGLYILLFLCAPLIADFYHKPELTPLARYSFLGFVLSAFGTAQGAVLFKYLKVKQRAISQIIALTISGCVGIIMAYNGFSYWSIATQNLVCIGLTTILYWYFSPWRPTLNINLNPLKEMFGFSSKLLVTGIFSHVNYNLFSLILGRYYNTRDVGFYDQAYKWSSMGGLFILGTINSVAQPVLSSLRDEQEFQRRAFMKLMLFTCSISFPLMLGMAFVAEGLVMNLLTDKWAPVIPLLQLLCISGAFVPVTNLYQQLLISRGRSDLYMWGVICEGMLILICLILTSPYGVVTMLKVYVILYIGYVTVWHWLGSRSLKMQIC